MHSQESACMQGGIKHNLPSIQGNTEQLNSLYIGATLDGEQTNLPLKITHSKRCKLKISQVRANFRFDKQTITRAPLLMLIKRYKY